MAFTKTSRAQLPDERVKEILLGEFWASAFFVSDEMGELLVEASPRYCRYLYRKRALAIVVMTFYSKAFLPIPRSIVLLDLSDDSISSWCGDSVTLISLKSSCAVADSLLWIKFRHGENLFSAATMWLM